MPAREGLTDEACHRGIDGDVVDFDEVDPVAIRQAAVDIDL